METDTQHLLRPRPYPPKLSLVVPMFNEEPVVAFLRTALHSFMHEVQGETEVILVNDGSSDGTLGKIAAWAAEDPRIKVIHLSRNFGHQIAATAGLDFAAGDAVVLIDADLQDPLSVIHRMIDRYREGYDAVYGQREKRAGESAFKRLTAWLFYRLMRGMVYQRLPVDTGDFRLISRECLDGLRSMRESHRFLRGMVAWVGYPQCSVQYQRAARVAGETKYPLRKMMAFAWTAATSFSTVPLQFSIALGALVGLVGLEEGVRALLSQIFGWYTVRGWSSLMIMVSFIGGALLISVGIVGQYVGMVYEQVKGRPLYLVARTFNVGDLEAAETLTRTAAGTRQP